MVGVAAAIARRLVGGPDHCRMLGTRTGSCRTDQQALGSAEHAAFHSLDRVFRLSLIHILTMFDRDISSFKITTPISNQIKVILLRNL